ncbi:MAG: hypothetical protein RLZZ196_1929 [Bacteroidota bacterium]|jgi:sugar-specific transcriptional regulator TrmB
MKKAQQIAILNSRRQRLEENAQNMREEFERLSRRLEHLKSTIQSVENEAYAIQSMIVDVIDFNKIEVKLRVCEEFTEVRMKRLLLEIHVDGINEPIFKFLSLYESELLKGIKNTADKMVFESKVKRFAADYLKVHLKLNERGGYELSQSTTIDDYLNDLTVDSRINRQRIMINR